MIHGAGYGEIAKRFSLKPMNVWQHIRKGHHTAQLKQMDRDSRMVRLESLDDAVRAVAEEVLSILRTNPDPDVQLRAVARILQSQELHGKLTGRISTGPIHQFIVQMGAKNEAEIKAGLQLLRSGESVTLRDAFDDALALLKMALLEHPEWRGDALQVVASLADAEVSGNGACATA